MGISETNLSLDLGIGHHEYSSTGRDDATPVDSRVDAMSRIGPPIGVYREASQPKLATSHRS